MLRPSQVKPSDFIKRIVCHYASPRRQRKQLVMLNGYIDDSGSEPGSPTFVLAGYVLPADRWAEFSDEWDDALKSGRRIEYLHMKETGRDVSRKEGQFLGWTLEEIGEKVLSMAHVISAYQPISLAAHCQWSEFEIFKKTSTRAKYITNPYKALLHEIIRIMYAANLRFDNLESVDFVFDEQGKIGEEAIQWYSEMKASFPIEAQKVFGSTPVFRNDKQVLPLQAADLFAWIQRRRIWKPPTMESFLKTEELITEYFAVGSELNANSFERMAIMFEDLANRRISR